MNQRETTPSKSKLQKPPLYNLVLLNDDYTPTEFVEAVLETIFGFSETITLMMAKQIRENGKMIVGMYTKDVTYTYIKMISDVSEDQGFPLKAVAEVVE